MDNLSHPQLCATVERALRAARVDPEDLRWETAGSAGSGRAYWRLSASDGRSWVLQTSHAQDLDWHRFVEYGRLFHELGLSVPQLFAIDEAARQVLQQDLGSERLWDAWNRTSDITLYQRALEELTRWQCRSQDAFGQSAELAGRAFDQQALRWETGYYSEHYLCGQRGWSTDEIARLFPAFDALASRVAAHPRGLMHRDFQSHNIMVAGVTVVFIDFQGARNGSLYYDAASLLCDPYVMLPMEQVSVLFSAWAERHPLLAEFGPEENRLRFLDAALQRLMQALGAYCNLSRNKGIEAFAGYIAPGENRLREVQEARSRVVSGTVAT